LVKSKSAGSLTVSGAVSPSARVRV